jgi:hypothetical protein
MQGKARDKLHSKATKLVRGRAKRIFDEALKVSPQWSGDFAANWTIETNQTGSLGYRSTKKVTPWRDLQWWDTGVDSTAKEKKSFSSGTYDDKPMAKYAGAPDAIALARVVNYARIETLKWNTNVRLVNKSPTADLIESGEVNLRRVNTVTGTVGVMTYLKSKYPNILS